MLSLIKEKFCLFTGRKIWHWYNKVIHLLKINLFFILFLYIDRWIIVLFIVSLLMISSNLALFNFFFFFLGPMVLTSPDFTPSLLIIFLYLLLRKSQIHYLTYPNLLAVYLKWIVLFLLQMDWNREIKVK